MGFTNVNCKTSVPAMTQRRRLAEHALERHGKPSLDQFVSELRASGCSWATVVKEIYRATEGEMDLAEHTLRSWFLDGGHAA